jgi:hypothetical protein
VVVVLEMLTLMVLVLMMYRPIAFAFHLCLPPEFLSTFVLCLFTLRDMRWSIGRSTVTLAYRKNDG